MIKLDSNIKFNYILSQHEESYFLPCCDVLIRQAIADIIITLDRIRIENLIDDAIFKVENNSLLVVLKKNQEHLFEKKIDESSLEDIYLAHIEIKRFMFLATNP